MLDMDRLYTMNPEVKAEWLARLRSGEIPQAKSKLHRTDGSMCCLGVLANIAVDEGLMERSLPEGKDYHFFIDTSGISTDGSLTKELCRWSGLVNEDGDTRYGVLPFTDRGGSSVYLDSLNDSGMPFDQIADLIEYWY